MVDLFRVQVNILVESVYRRPVIFILRHLLLIFFYDLGFRMVLRLGLDDYGGVLLVVLSL